MAVENAQLPVLGSAPSQKTGRLTERNDAWWTQPAATFIVFTAFIIYTTWRTFENSFYETWQTADLATRLHYTYLPHYLSPFYSPTLGAHLTIGGFNISPALWILPFPLAFRTTCYYYRKAYYRAFFWDPPACAVGEVAPRHKYTGEREFPFVLQNLHRYAWYAAVVILAILWWDAYEAFQFTDPATGSTGFFLGLGSIIFLVNVVLLSGYTFGCHSCRHLAGGCLNCFSQSSGTMSRHSVWEKITHLNENHAVWAWASLISVALTDLYVRLVATGAVHDIRFF